jgi:hypothetical protein
MVFSVFVVLLSKIGVTQYLVGFTNSLESLVCSIVARIFV